MLSKPKSLELQRLRTSDAEMFSTAEAYANFLWANEHIALPN